MTQNEFETMLTSVESLTTNIQRKANIMALDKKQLQADMANLLSNVKEAIVHDPTKVAGFSLLQIAYGTLESKDQVLPTTEAELAFCETRWAALPEHRKTALAENAILRARLALKK